MKKSILIAVVLLAMSTYADACIAANAKVEYPTMFISLSGIDNSSFNFSNNSIGGKAVIGFGTPLDYLTMGATFEMYGKFWGSTPIVNAKDWRGGLQFGFNPFAQIDRESAVKFRIMGEVGYSSCCKSVYNGYGARLEFGKGVTSLFIQDMAQFDYVNSKCQWSNRVEIGLQFKFNIGSGRVYCNK